MSCWHVQLPTFQKRHVLWAQFNIHLLPQLGTCSRGHAAPGKTLLNVLSAWNGEGQSPSSPGSGGSCDSCALQGPSCLHPSICLTDGLHMQDRSPGLWARCAHAAAACPALVAVRQPGLSVSRAFSLCSPPSARSLCAPRSLGGVSSLIPQHGELHGTLRLRPPLPARHSCTKTGQSFLLHHCLKHLQCFKLKVEQVFVLSIQVWCGSTRSRWLFPEKLFSQGWQLIASRLVQVK